MDATELLSIVTDEEKQKKVNFQTAGNITMTIGTFILLGVIGQIKADPSIDVLDLFLFLQVIVGGIFLFGGYSILKIREEKVKGLSVKAAVAKAATNDVQKIPVETPKTEIENKDNLDDELESVLDAMMGNDPDDKPKKVKKKKKSE